MPSSVFKMGLDLSDKKTKYLQAESDYQQVLSEKIKGFPITFKVFFQRRNSYPRIICMLKRSTPTCECFSKICSVLVKDTIGKGFLTDIKFTYFDFFKSKGVLDWVFDILQVQEPCTEEKIETVCKILCMEYHKDTQTCLDFFMLKSDLSTFIELKNSLSSIEYLNDVCKILTTPISKQETFLELFAEKKMLYKILALSENFTPSIIENLGKICQLLNKKISNRDQTFVDVFDMNLSTIMNDILENPDSTDVENFTELFEILCTKLDDSDKIYLDFFPASHLEIKFSKNLQVFKDICEVLSTKVENIQMTRFEYFKMHDLMDWIIKQALYQIRLDDSDAAGILKLCETLTTKSDFEEQTHLTALVKSWVWLTESLTLCDCTKTQRIITILSKQVESSDQVYADFLKSELTSFQFKRLTNRDIKDFEELCRLLSMKITTEETYLNFFMQNNMYDFLLSVIDRSSTTCVETVEKLIKLLNRKIDSRDSTYSEFFKSNALQLHDSSFFGISLTFDEVEAHCNILNKKLLKSDQNYFEFFKKHSCLNVWKRLSAELKQVNLEKACLFLSNNEEIFLEIFEVPETAQNILKLLSILKFQNIESVCRKLLRYSFVIDCQNYLDFIALKKAWPFVFDILQALEGPNVMEFDRLLACMLMQNFPKLQHGIEFFQEKPVSEAVSALRQSPSFKVDDLRRLHRALNVTLNSKYETCLDFFNAIKLWRLLCNTLEKTGTPAVLNVESLCLTLSFKFVINFDLVTQGKCLWSQSYCEFLETKSSVWLVDLVEWSLINGAENLGFILQLLCMHIFKNDQTCLDFLESIAARHWFFEFLLTSETSALLNLIEIFKLLSAKEDLKNETYLNFLQTKSGSLLFKEMASKSCLPSELKNRCNEEVMKNRLNFLKI